jgi:hypothetical protein
MAEMDTHSSVAGSNDGSEVCEQIQILAALTKQALYAIHDITWFAQNTVANTLEEAPALGASWSGTTATVRTAEEEALLQDFQRQFLLHYLKHVMDIVDQANQKLATVVAHLPPTEPEAVPPKVGIGLTLDEQFP